MTLKFLLYDLSHSANTITEKNNIWIYMLIFFHCKKDFFYLGAATGFYYFSVNSGTMVIVEFDNCNKTMITSKYFYMSHPMHFM